MSAPDVLETDWLKVDFHLHTSEDPRDVLEHSAVDLLHRARSLGFGALAITLHDRVLADPEVFATARELGLLLIPAIERRLDGADVVIVNISAEEAAQLERLDDLRDLRQRRGKSVLILAPHPFYIFGDSIGARLLDYIEVFDAIELCHFYTRWFNLNRRAIKVSSETGKPLLAASDTHVLGHFGNHYSLIQAAKTASPEEIFDAIRAKRIQIVTEPLSTLRLFRRLWWIYVQHQWRYFRLRVWPAR